MCFELGKIFSRLQRDGGRVNLKVFPKKIAVNAEAEHYLWPVRDGRLSADMLEWNDVLQFYRGRNEHKVAFVKDGCAAL